MSIVGKVDSLWRYPVKSMQGQELDAAYMGFSGFYGDRLFALKNASGPKGFPYLTGREKQEILRYRPRFRDAEDSVQPPNLNEAKAIAPGLNPVHASPADLLLDVETPSGEIFPIDDAKLLSALRSGSDHEASLTLLRSDRAMTDCRPVSLFSIQTAKQLEYEMGVPVDQRRFRSNIYLDLETVSGFGEDRFVGRSLRIGSTAVVSILEPDPRCKMITLDPDTGESNPEFLRKVAQDHNGTAGVYAAVLVEGTLHRGDAVELLS